MNRVGCDRYVRISKAVTASETNRPYECQDRKVLEMIKDDGASSNTPNSCARKTS